MRKSETHTETLQGASAEAWFGMHSVEAQKAVIDVLNYGALKKVSSEWHQEPVGKPLRPCQGRPIDLQQVRHQGK
jgi:hypothetical protein